MALVRPRVVLAMGRFAVQSLLKSSEPLGKLRGRVHQVQGVPVIVTPDVIVKNPNKDAFIRVYSNGNMYGSRGTKTTFRHVDKKLSDRENQKTSRKP